MKRFLIITAVLFFVLSPSVCADVYSEQYGLSGADKLGEALPESARRFFEDAEIDFSSPDWVNEINAGNVFTLLWDSLRSGGKKPFVTGGSVLALLVLTAAFSAFSEKGETPDTVNYISVLSLGSAVLLPVYSVITATARTVKAAGNFMLAFLPVFCTVLTASGKPVTASAAGGTLLAASEGLSFLAGSVITPVIGSYMAVCLCGGVSGQVNTDGISDLIKKAVTFSEGLIMTVYIGVLSVQTTVNAAADSLALKTGKFMLGSFVPVVGAPMGEALATVQGCLTLLRSSVGMYGIAALVVILLPTLLELTVWRLVLNACAAVAGVFGCKSAGGILKSADSALSFLFGILLINAVAFTVGLTILVNTGG